MVHEWTSIDTQRSPGATKKMEGAKVKHQDQANHPQPTKDDFVIVGDPTCPAPKQRDAKDEPYGPNDPFTCVHAFVRRQTFRT